MDTLSRSISVRLHRIQPVGRPRESRQPSIQSDSQVNLNECVGEREINQFLHTDRGGLTYFNLAFAQAAPVRACTDRRRMAVAAHVVPVATLVDGPHLLTNIQH